MWAALLPLIKAAAPVIAKAVVGTAATAATSQGLEKLFGPGDVRTTAPGQIPQMEQPEDPFAWFEKIQSRKGGK